MVEKYKLSREEKQAFLKVLHRVYRSGDEREFMNVLRKHGIKDEDPRFAAILSFFRALRSGKA